MKDELERPARSRKRRLNLGTNRVISIIDQLNWPKLQVCFGNSFEFNSEMKYELANELALQHGRLDQGLNGNMPFELRRVRESSKTLMDQLNMIFVSDDTQNMESIKKVYGNDFSQEKFEFILNRLANIKSTAHYRPPYDLYRDCMKSIASQLNKAGINLSLYKNSPFHRFMMELDNQIPHTIFPATDANFADDSRFRIMRDYLRAWARENLK